MAMMPGPSRPADNDIYTALVFAAFLCLLGATIYVGWRAVTQLGTLLPPPGV
jgi:hypothetical protein